MSEPDELKIEDLQKELDKLFAKFKEFGYREFMRKAQQACGAIEKDKSKIPHVRKLQMQMPRVENGNVQFGDDWVGLFLRGDACFGFATHLAKALETKDIDPVAKIVLYNLLELLEDTNETKQLRV